MLEYVFFDQEIAERFLAQVQKLGITAQPGHGEGVVIEVDEDVDDSLSDEIDELYEQLLQDNADLIEEGEDALEKNVAGVQVQLQDGSPCTIRLEPDLVGRMLTVLTMEEIRDLAQTIAEGVESRDNRPLCHT